jgi:hypothetical protein
VVEGAPLSASRDDAGDYRIEILQDFGGGNSQGVEADFGETPIASRVAFGPVAPAVEFTVHFNREPCFEASEIETITELRVLTTKAEATRFLAQLLPEQDFGE